MSFAKRHPFVAALLIVVAGAILGTVVGWILGVRETNMIAEAVRARDPHDPLDGLPFIAFGIIAAGFVAGIVVGIIAAVIHYFLRGRRAKFE